VEGFVALGIGPLNYDEDFVENSNVSHPSLKGGLLFLAQRMGLRGPPLDISYRYEKSIFNEFVKANPGHPTKKTWVELANSFKLKANYITIFPKLPFMLARSYKKWKDSQEVVLAKETIKGPYYELLCRLARPRSEHEMGKAAQFQQIEVRKQLQEENNLGETSTEALVRDAFVGVPENPLPVPPLAAPT
jgi:hypothetical protein